MAHLWNENSVQLLSWHKYKSISIKASESQMLQMVKLKLLDSTGNSLESIDLGTMVTLKIGLNKILGERLRQMSGV